MDRGVEDEEVAGEVGELAFWGVAAEGREGRRGGRARVLAAVLARLALVLLLLMLCVEVAVKELLGLWAEGAEGLFLSIPFPVWLLAERVYICRCCCCNGRSGEPGPLRRYLECMMNGGEH